jgi:predicted ATP-grasp superfamily ATP-dependent carboligase
LKLDPAPLVEQAEKFESKLKGMMTKNQEAQDLQERKQMSYVG